MALKPAIFVLGESGRELASRIAGELAAEVIDPIDVKGELRGAFLEGRPIVGICASGILIRLLAPLLSDKSAEPPVVAVAEDGSAAVPLLGGHHGANDLARRIAERTGGFAAITTATDLRFGINLDSPHGYVLANREHFKGFLARLLAGEKLRAKGEAPWLTALPCAAEAPLSLLVSEYAVPGSEDALVYHPRSLVLGVGCERNASCDELLSNVEESLAGEGLARASIACVATIDLKADEQAVNALAAHLGIPLRLYSSAELQQEELRLKHPSSIVLREVGTASVAEAAALRACGVQAELLVPKRVRGRTTCAVARAPQPIDPESVGRARGSLAIVGIGPGCAAWRSPAAESTLRAADDWVGYDLYLDLVSDLHSVQRQHRFALGEEELRALHALNLSGEGRRVALICSGDAGIYAMASLVYELLDPRSGAALSEAARRIEIEVVPGISALQAAAARAGAILGNDFCAISLSDLLTPWGVIETRLNAAAAADFAVALYNPRSHKRTGQLETAMAIFRSRRPAATPVVLATNLGRRGECVRVLPLCDFDCSEVDMLSIVIVGSSSSRSFHRGDGSIVAYTPRGYEGKRKPRP